MQIQGLNLAFLAGMSNSISGTELYSKVLDSEVGQSPKAETARRTDFNGLIGILPLSCDASRLQKLMANWCFITRSVLRMVHYASER
jgi:hypothetical protein